MLYNTIYTEVLYSYVYKSYTPHFLIFKITMMYF